MNSMMNFDRIFCLNPVNPVPTGLKNSKSGAPLGSNAVHTLFKSCAVSVNSFRFRSGNVSLMSVKRGGLFGKFWDKVV